MSPATDRTALSLGGSLQQLRSDRALVESLIENGNLGVDFQPVCRLDDGSRIGWKASAKGPAGTAMASPAGLLQSAKATGHVERVDWMWRCKAFDLALEAELSGPLFLTPEVETFGSPCPPRLAVSYGRAKRELQIVVDIAARAFDEPELLRRGLDDFGRDCWRVSVDDIADRDDALVELASIRPDIVRIDMRLPGRLPGDDAEPAVTHLVDWATKHGVTIGADNVDTEAQRAAALAFGAVFGRGRLFGAPAPMVRPHN